MTTAGTDFRSSFRQQRSFVEKTGTFDQVDYENGIAYGFAIVCTENGAPYFDLQGDHIPEEVMTAAAVEFFSGQRVGKDQHTGDQVADLVFGMPMTKSFASAEGIVTKKTGLLVGYKPQDPVQLDMIARGERTGFSIGGFLLDGDEVEIGKAVWSQAYQDALPDSAFLHVKSGGAKDKSGKTTPRSNRMFPVRGSDGSVDPAHVSNAISRVASAKLPDDVKAKVRAAAAKLQADKSVTKAAGDDVAKATGRVFRAFRLAEISLVDRPAQEGATVAVVKSLARDEAVIKSVVLTDAAKGHQHVLWVDRLDGDDYSGTSYDAISDDSKDCHSHRAVIKDGKVVLSMNLGHTHDVTMPDGWQPPVGSTDDDAVDTSGGLNQPGVIVTIENAAPRADKLTDTNPSDSVQRMTITEAELAALNARLAKAEKLNTMSDALRAYYNRLDASAQSAFIGKSLVEMETESKASEVWKSASGVSYYRHDDARTVALAQENERISKALDDERQLRKDAEVAKRAVDLAALPGDEKTIVALVKSVDGIADATLRAAVETTLKAAANLASQMTVAYGGTGDGATPAIVDANGAFYAKRDEWATTHKVPCATDIEKAKATQAFMKTPEGAQLYKAINAVTPARTA